MQSEAVTAPQSGELDGWEVSTNVVETPPQSTEAQKAVPVTEPAPAVDPGDEDDAEDQQTREEKERDSHGRFRHRAKSDRATPADVPRIQKLTAKLRETERRLAEIEARTAPKVETPKPPARPELRKVEGKSFDEPEPKLEDFASSDDPYRDYMRKLAAWDRKKEAFEARQEYEKTRVEREGKDHAEKMQAWGREREAEYHGRMESYLKANPTAAKDFESASNRPITPVMYAAITLSDRGPELFHALAKDEELSDDLVAVTKGQALTDDIVAYVQRKIARTMTRSTAATTGSVAPEQPVGNAPRPPNPVRTAPMKLSQEPPGDESSLAEHEAAYHKKRRR